MGKITKIIAAFAMFAILVPVSAQAFSVNLGGAGNVGSNNSIGEKEDVNHELSEKADLNSRNGDQDGREGKGEHDFANVNANRHMGTVTALGANSFTMTGKDSIVYTVDTTGTTTYSLPFKGILVFSDIKVNDSVKVLGPVSGTIITATSIIDTPVNMKAKKASGTVTAVNGSTLTVQTKDATALTVNTNANTVVTKADGTTGTMADILVGSSLKIRGLWDSVLNVFNAIKIKLKV